VSESSEQWKKEYESIPKDQTLKLDVKSPENFIDDIKLEYIRPALPQYGIVVEVGAGSGRFLTRIALENKNIIPIGIDFESSKMIKDNFDKFNIDGISLKADAYHIPLPDNSASAIISGGFLEHFNEDEIDKILQEMRRILRPGALFYAEIVPNKRSLCRPIILTKTGGYESSFSKQEWKKILERNGFKNVKIVTGIVIPPNFYNWCRSGILLEIIYKFKYMIEHMDNTFISDLLGFSYYVISKPETERI